MKNSQFQSIANMRAKKMKWKDIGRILRIQWRKVEQDYNRHKIKGESRHQQESDVPICDCGSLSFQLLPDNARYLLAMCHNCGTWFRACPGFFEGHMWKVSLDE